MQVATEIAPSGQRPSLLLPTGLEGLSPLIQECWHEALSKTVWHRLRPAAGSPEAAFRSFQSDHASGCPKSVGQARLISRSDRIDAGCQHRACFFGHRHEDPAQRPTVSACAKRLLQLVRAANAITEELEEEEEDRDTPTPSIDSAAQATASVVVLAGRTGTHVPSDFRSIEHTVSSDAVSLNHTV